MPSGGADLNDISDVKDRDDRLTMIEAGAGTWTAGHLYLDLTTNGVDPIRILNIKPIISPTQLPAPRWIYEFSGGCGGPNDRVFKLDLDVPSFKDQGVAVGDTPTEPNIPTESIGEAFVVDPTNPALVRIDATSCLGNYEWSIRVTYSHQGVIKELVRGPFLSFGAADETKVYTLGLSASNAKYPVTPVDIISGTGEVLPYGRCRYR